MHDDLERRVLEFVARERITRVGRLSLATTLLGDLGIDGDDAGDLLKAYASEFNVDLSDFDFFRHFGPEGLGCNFPIVWAHALFRTGTPEQRVGLTAISIGDLVQAARRGRWHADFR